MLLGYNLRMSEIVWIRRMLSQFLKIIGQFSDPQNWCLSEEWGEIANSVSFGGRDFIISSHIPNIVVISNLRKFCVPSKFSLTRWFRHAGGGKLTGNTNSKSSRYWVCVTIKKSILGVEKLPNNFHKLRKHARNPHDSAQTKTMIKKDSGPELLAVKV